LELEKKPNVDKFFVEKKVTEGFLWDIGKMKLNHNWKVEIFQEWLK
jgi:hypothetical protein